MNKVSDGQTEEVIRLEGWTPLNLCVSSSDDFLVVFINNKETHSKLVRYSETSEKQTIQFDEEGKPLYSGNFKIKCPYESRNMDICLADYEAGAVVVVNQAGNSDSATPVIVRLPKYIRLFRMALQQTARVRSSQQTVTTTVSMS